MNNTQKTIVKTVQKKEDLFIEFTEDEMKDLNIEPHDKFEIDLKDDNTIVLKKFEKIDLNLSEFDRTTLEMLVSKSIESQVPVDEVIREVLTQYLENKPSLTQDNN
jgi:hypothetical protein